MKSATLVVLLFAQHVSGADPDIHRTICEIVLSKRPQYACEVVNVTTPDAYVLETMHIYHPPAVRPVKPVLLWHGLMDCAFSWVMNNPAQSLPYLLVELGYEVWLGNSRGTRYGLGHKGGLSPKDVAFWDFTWDQIAQYDVPATIEHIRESSGATKVGYVGHSQGTIQMFAALSAGYLQPAQIAFFGALAPVIAAPHQRDLILGLMSSKAVVWMGRAVDKKAFTIPKFLQPAVDAACLVTPRMCNSLLELFVGKAHNLNVSRIDVMAAHEPGGTSTLNMAHW